jgi:hypothetical protein
LKNVFTNDNILKYVLGENLQTIIMRTLNNGTRMNGITVAVYRIQYAPDGLNKVCPNGD